MLVKVALTVKKASELRLKQVMGFPFSGFGYMREGSFISQDYCTVALVMVKAAIIVEVTIIARLFVASFLCTFLFI